MLRRSRRLALLRQEEDSIRKLPDDILQQCLLRVPYKSHSNLKAVCRKWRDLVSAPKFYEERMITGTREHLICMVQYLTVSRTCRIIVLDPLTHSWTMLCHIPDFPTGIPLFCKCVCVNGKLVLIGRRSPEKFERMSRVYIFDFVSSKWRRGADMPTRRFGFACFVLSSTGLIYVAGGKDGQNALVSAETYNVEEDKWEILPPMNQQLGYCHGVFLGEKFFVLGRNENDVEIFDANTGLWRSMDNMWRFGPWFKSPSLVASGHLYTFTDRQLMKYDAEKNDWLPETVFPTKFRGAPVCAAEWRRYIFVSKPRNDSRRQVCYLLNPSTDELIEFYIPANFAGMTTCAATVEI